MLSKILFCATALLVVSSPTWAEPLPLSETQIQALKKYVQPDDEAHSLVWKGDPLSIALPLKAEKRVIFPEAIEAHLNSQLNADQLRVINNDHALYLTALQPFNATRIYVTLKQSQKVVLMDLLTSDKATPTTETVTLPLSLSKPDSTFSSSSSFAKTRINSSENSSFSSLSSLSSTSHTSISTANSYVDAIRFAWQQLYAPGRLLNSDTSFIRTPMRTQPWVSHLIYGDLVWAHPQVSWVSGHTNFYITAVELRNKYAHPTTIRLQHDICGSWQAASLYPRATLQAAGNKAEDSTTLFLISTQPFAKTLEDCDARA